MESPLPLDLAELVGDCATGFKAGLLSEGFGPSCSISCSSGLRNTLRDEGRPQAAVDAVLALRPCRIDLVPLKLAAVLSFQEMPEAEALAAANKRIVEHSEENGGELPDVDVALLQEAAEKELFSQVVAAQPLVKSQPATMPRSLRCWPVCARVSIDSSTE